MQHNIWFTPEGLEDLLPEQALKLEHYRRQLLDGFQLTGYDLVLPPLAEFTDSLLTGTGRHLAIDTCRFTDQESGRMMGVRADMTPQVARIATHRLKEKGLSRLCYVGEVLKTRNNKAKGSRSPIQVGAELFGHSGSEADIEIIHVMVESLKTIGISEMIISLGHVAIVDTLLKLANLSEAQEAELIDILQRKAVPEYEAFIVELNLSVQLTQAFAQLLNLSGPVLTVLDRAQTLLAPLDEQIAAALSDLAETQAFVSQIEGVQLHCDLADMRGYQYHTGMIFSAYASGRKTNLLAKGGRYDGIGSDFGTFKPATGFSLDLRGALDLLPEVTTNSSEKVYAPLVGNAALMQMIAQLKAAQTPVEYYFDLAEVPAGAPVLTESNGQWSVAPR